MRGLGARLAALALALAFQGGAAIDALALHPCPHHTELPAPAGAPGHAAEEHGHGSDTARHAHSDAPAQGEEHDHAGPCTCVGTCESSGAAPALVASAASMRQAPVAEASVLSPAAGEALPGLPPHFLPYSNGPPRAA